MNDVQLTNALKPISSHRHIFLKIYQFGTQSDLPILRVRPLPKVCVSTARLSYVYLFIMVNQFLTSSPVVFSTSSGQFSFQSSNYCWRVNPEQFHFHHPQVKSPGRQQLLLSVKWDNTWVRLMSINLSLSFSLFHCHSRELRLQVMRNTNEPKTKDCTEHLKTNDASSLFVKFFLFLWLRKKDSAQH